jgi:hypothetical protein
MELLLNLLWLAMVAPAIWFWRRRPSHAGIPWFGSWRPILLLGCVLVLLFPVISATDDLHAMRPEMEESSASKRLLKQVGSAKASAWTHSTNTFLSGFAAESLGRDDRVCGLVWIPSAPSPKPVIFNRKACRAPPATSL